MNFIQFTKNNYPNFWIKEPGIDIYIRDTRNVKFISTDFDLANLNAEQKGRGSLTKFLNLYEPKFTFRFENIMNERLIEFLKKRNYEIEKIDLNLPNMKIMNRSQFPIPANP